MNKDSKKQNKENRNLVFEAMKSLIDDTNLNKIILVSGDGDYKKMVDYLIEKDTFLKILFPNKRFASSLYKKLGDTYFSHLSDNGVRKKVEYKKRAP